MVGIFLPCISRDNTTFHLCWNRDNCLLLLLLLLQDDMNSRLLMQVRSDNLVRGGLEAEPVWQGWIEVVGPQASEGSIQCRGRMLPELFRTELPLFGWGWLLQADHEGVKWWIKFIAVTGGGSWPGRSHFPVTTENTYYRYSFRYHMHPELPSTTRIHN